MPDTMPDSLQQDTRFASFESPLGKDKLALVTFEGSEGLSELFEFRVIALGEEPGLDFDKLLGERCAVGVKSFDGVERWFNGIAAEGRAIGPQEKYHGYEIVLRPWFWLMTKTANCRIFHEKTVLEIIQLVFDDHDFAAGNWRKATTQTYPRMEYCVQYRESDFVFLCRLMEQFGIYYFFEHGKDAHKLVLADSTSSHKRIDDLTSVAYIPDESSDQNREQCLWSWIPARGFQTGQYTVRDYNYMTPGASNLEAQTSKGGKYASSTLEVYDFPNTYATKDEGSAYAKVRIEAEQARDKRRGGKGDAVSLFPGALVKLKRHDDDAENQKYLVVRATHSVSAQSYSSGGMVSEGGDRPYEGTFEFLETNIPYRAPEETEKPKIYGAQIAMVGAGKDAQSSDHDVDQHGRVLLNFFWDNKTRLSRRVRTGQLFSGPGWGSQFIPRIGMEVIVIFEHGNPDRPLVIGTVYNKDVKFPYPLPENVTMSGMKSNSSTGGGGYNELMFEDKKSSEIIRMHAQKTHEVVILDNETKKIGKEGQHTHTRDTTIVTGNDKLDIQAGDQIVSIKVDRDVTIHGDDKLEIMGKQTEKVQGNHELTVNGEIKITAMQKITLTCGASTIKISPSGIEIMSGTISLTAPKIDLN